jgi:hypothetical protein
VVQCEGNLNLNLILASIGHSVLRMVQPWPIDFKEELIVAIN